jgi:2-polyprenyl-3-methyl-5-hydroxy-6-metoxy-1,4-benzoquinol methylase
MRATQAHSSEKNQAMNTMLPQSTRVFYDTEALRKNRWAIREGNFREKVRYERTKALFQKRIVHGLVLDLGCADGAFTNALIAPEVELVGIDISANYLSSAKRHLPCASFLQADAERLPIRPETLAGVSCFEILEHVENDSAVLEQIVDSLKIKGILVASVPLTPILDTSSGHVRIYSRESITLVLKKAGLRLLWHEPLFSAEWDTLNIVLLRVLRRIPLLRSVVYRNCAIKSHLALEWMKLTPRLAILLDCLLVKLFRDNLFLVVAAEKDATPYKPT